MRIALFSDVHSNLEALNAVLQELERETPDRVLFLGDAVGYGPDPNACVEKICEVADKIIVGNHDHAVVGLTDPDFYNPYAKKAILWSRSVLTQENQERILSWPLKEWEEDLFLVHASPYYPEKWFYLATLSDAADQFEYFKEKTCWIGHTHQPAVYACDEDRTEEIKESMLTFKENFRYIVNAGSVGQPRDGNPDACYLIYDTGTKRLSFKRVAYDLRITQEKMRAAHLPSFLIERLETGS